jgi:hypothetical protein
LLRRSQGKTIAYLSGFGLTPYQVDKIMDKLGNLPGRRLPGWG